MGVPSSELLLPAPLLCPQQVAGPGFRRLCPPGSPALGSLSRVAPPQASPPRLPETAGATSLRHGPALGPLRTRVLSHPLCGGGWRSSGPASGNEGPASPCSAGLAFLVHLRLRNSVLLLAPRSFASAFESLSLCF